MLRFLDGQLADVLAEGLNESEALGWTGTFMKQGMSAMVDMGKTAMGFSGKGYREGLYMSDDINENELFYGLFSEWRSIVKMEPKIRTRAMEKIEGVLEKRVEGIMSASRRKYCGECAAYLAALGEAKESLGEIGAKQRLMTSYKDRYSRRNAFRAKMQAYGWIDMTKNKNY